MINQDETTGLSPLARGTPIVGLLILLPPRFIPAGAGNTFKRYFTDSSSTVYPRWRGEHVPSTLSGYCCRGLSPLARGTH